jgi:hypothetical protein
MKKSRRSLSANLLVFVLSVMPYKANRENHSTGGLSADIREVPPLNQPPASRITAGTPIFTPGGQSGMAMRTVSTT